MATTLLLADDSPTIAKILKMALQSEAYEIRSVENAHEALRELKNNPPDIFLVDLTLPSKSGYEFAKIIRSDSKMSKTRVVLLSSAFDPADAAQVAACGADLVVVKPFDPSDLRASLRLLVNASPKFPAGSHVQGAVSGEAVGISEPGFGDLPEGPQGSADDILGSLLGQSENSSPSIPSIGIEMKSGITEIREELPVPEDSHDPLAGEQVLDLSQNFSAPENATAMIDLSSLEGGEALQQTKPLPLPALSAAKPPQSKGIAPLPSLPSAPAIQETKAPIPPSPPVPSVEPKAAELSSNAQALAAFFEAEISKSPAPKTEPNKEAEPENFDASLASIEWASPPKENLENWSSSSVASATSSSPKAQPPKVNAKPMPIAPLAKTPVQAPQTEVPKIREPLAANPKPSFQAPKEKAPVRSGVDFSDAQNMLFDTGGSNFSFSTDYVNRITRAFTGAHHEEVPVQHSAPNAPMFHNESHDAPKASSPSSAPHKDTGGGAWTDKEVQKIEQLVKDEVQMVVREVVEKIAWEVIPELAENLIKKELEKVLKQLDN